MSLFFIDGIGIVVPGMTRDNSDELVRILAQKRSVVPKIVESIPLTQGIKPQDVRRLARLSRLSLVAADRCRSDTGALECDAGLYVGITHGSTSMLKEFLDFLYDYGPEMASPNAFSNCISGAPMGAISAHFKLTKGGFTIVGFENAGLETLQAAVEALERGDCDICYAGAAEEYSPHVEEAYASCGFCPSIQPSILPWCGQKRQGVELSEGAVFFAVTTESLSRRGKRYAIYEPIDDIKKPPKEVDVVISGAGGGPQDPYELDVLLDIGSRFVSPPALLFPKLWFGETFVVSSMISVAIACHMVATASAPSFISPVHRSLRPLYRCESAEGFLCSTVLIIAASRYGKVSAAIVRRSQ